MQDNIIREFEKYLKSHDTSIMASFHPHFQQAFWEMVLNGGKRFRPSLLLSVVSARKPHKIKDAFKVALALESLHTYSLIHDDLPDMDNANLRRGHKTLHIKYSPVSAILAGDGLNSYAFYLIADSKFSAKTRAKLTHSLGFNAVKMVLGQACDCQFEKRKLPKDKLQFIHTNKTACLIASALEMGGIIAKLPKKQIKQLYDFGILLGIFFQVRDDIIDATESSDSAGKTTQNDSEKNSYVNLLGINGAKKELENQKSKIKQALKVLPSDITKNLKQILNPYLGVK